MQRAMMFLLGLGLFTGCTTSKVKDSQTGDRGPSSAPNCIAKICVGDKVYSYSMLRKQPMEVVGFQRRFGSAGEHPTGNPVIDFLAVLKDGNSHQSYQPTEDIREIYLDAGANACMNFRNDPMSKVCVGDTAVVIPLWNYQFPREAKEKIEVHQKKTGQRFTSATVLKVLKMNSQDSWAKEDRAIVQTKIPGVGTILVSSREIGFTKEATCAHGSTDVCVGAKFTTFFNEPFSILAYLPAGDNGSGDVQIVLTTPLKGLNGKDDFRVNDGFRQLIDPNYKVQSRSFKYDEFVQVGMNDSETEAMKKIDKAVAVRAKAECAYRVWGRGIMSSTKPFSPSYSNCNYSVDDNEYVGHGMVIGKTEPRRYLRCEFVGDLTCVDKDLK